MPSLSRYFRVTGISTGLNDGFALYRFGKSCCSIAARPSIIQSTPGCKGRFSFSRSADLAGNPEPRVVAIEFSEETHQGASLVRFFLGLLEDVPQRHVEKIDVVLAHESLGDLDRII